MIMQPGYQSVYKRGIEDIDVFGIKRSFEMIMSACLRMFVAWISGFSGSHKGAKR